MLNCLVIGIGGFMGAVLRYLIGLIPMSKESGFPIKTFFINIFGAFVIGVVVAAATKHAWNPKLILFLKVGVCGGFTTFSSFALETDQLLAKGEIKTAVLYVILSVIVGILAVFSAQKIIL